MKKLVILGTADGYEDAPYKEDVDIWGLPFHLELDGCKRVDVIFEVHRKDEYVQDTAEMIYDTDKPVYLQKKDKKVKNYKLYPFDKIREKYGEYVSNSFVLMFLLAIEQGYKEIEFYGVMFESDRERTIERCCLEHWVTKAERYGVTTTFDENSPLFKCNYFYGVDNILKHRVRIEKKIKKLTKKKLQYYDYMNFYEDKNEKEYNKYYKQYFVYAGAIDALHMELNQI